MSESGPLVNIGDLSKPVTVLIERIADSIGGIARPWQIIRVAKAETKADMIRAEGQIEINDLQRRSLIRFITEEAKRQQNIESIVQKAIPDVHEDAAPEHIEEDWLVHFFDRCRLVSEDRIQNLWSKLLAEEANTPGRFSKRTIDMLSTLEARDARLLRQIRTFCFEIDGGRCLQLPTAPTGLVPLILEVHSSSGGFIYEKYIEDLHTTLVHLAEINLLYYTGSQFALLEVPAEICYYDTTLRLRSERDHLGIGLAMFTKSGHELASICDSCQLGEFLEYILERWGSFCHIVNKSTSHKLSHKK